LYNAHLEVVHESIGQVSASGSERSKDNGVDDTPTTTVEHTSFGGPAQNNNSTAKSRAEQMAVQRRVRVT
jgi:hypothetical protein